MLVRWRLRRSAALTSLLVVLGLAGLADAQTAQLTLTWADNSSNEDGFGIQRKIGTSGTYVQRATTGSNANSYVDVGLTPGTTYCYRTFAFNVAGNSAYSNEACGTTAALPSMTIAATTATATEVGPAAGVFTVSRTGATTAALTVNYTVGGTATAGSDYVTLSGSLTIPAGAASAPITVTPINDTLVEPNETVVVTLAANAAYTLGAPASATVTLVSDDVASLPTVTIAATTATATEAGPTAGVFTVSRTGATTAALTVNYTVGGTATAGTDYTTLPGSLTIPIGAASARITVTPINDTLVEPNETVVVTLTANAAYTGAPASATVTLVSDDVASLPTVTIAATTATATEAGPTAGVFTVSRTGATTAALTVNYTVGGTATAGTDYTTLPGSLTIPIGAASARITVTPISDTLVEPNETVVVTLAANAAYTRGTPGSATVTLVGDDAPSNKRLIVTAPGAGGGPHVRTFDEFGDAGEVSLLAYSATFSGGVFVAAGDLDGDGDPEIITGPDSGGQPLVRTFRSSNAPFGVEFMAYDPAFTGGVRVAACDVQRRRPGRDHHRRRPGGWAARLGVEG